MKNPSPRRFLFVFILPLITLITSFLSKSVSGPFWQYGDSAYNYLFNAFQILKGYPPLVIAHPGTPLQVLIAWAIWVFNLGHTAAEAVNQALIDPEFYLQAVYIFLVAAIFLTSVILGIYVYRKTNDKLAVLLTQLMGLSFLILPSFDSSAYPALPVVANVDAEPLLIIIMNLFSLFLLGLYFSEKKSQELRNILLLAFICGLGLATKLNFLFILLSALMLVPFRRKLVFIAACAMSFVLCTFPIIGKYPQLFQWITDIVGHSSRYGTGSEKFIDWPSFIFNIKLIIRFDPFFIFSALGLWAWSSIHMIKSPKDRTAGFIWVLSFCCLLHIIATAKHFSFHYLLPGFALFSPIFLLFYLHQKAKYKILKPLTTGFILIFISVCAFYAVPYYKKLLTFTQDIRRFNDTINAKYTECTVIPATTIAINFSPNQQEAMLAANGATFRLEGEDLLRLYPHSYYFFSEEVTSPDPVESYGIWNYKQRVLGDDIMSAYPCAIFIKYASDFSPYPYQVQFLEGSRYLSAYFLVNSTEKEADDLFSQAMDAAKAGDYKKAMLLGFKSKQLNYEPRGQLEFFLTDIYHELTQGK